MVSSYKVHLFGHQIFLVECHKQHLCICAFQKAVSQTATQINSILTKCIFFIVIYCLEFTQQPLQMSNSCFSDCFILSIRVMMYLSLEILPPSISSQDTVHSHTFTTGNNFKQLIQLASCFGKARVFPPEKPEPMHPGISKLHRDGNSSSGLNQGPWSCNVAMLCHGYATVLHTMYCIMCLL